MPAVTVTLNAKAVFSCKYEFVHTENPL